MPRAFSPATPFSISSLEVNTKCFSGLTITSYQAAFLCWPHPNLTRQGLNTDAVVCASSWDPADWAYPSPQLLPSSSSTHPIYPSSSFASSFASSLTLAFASACISAIASSFTPGWACPLPQLLRPQPSSACRPRWPCCPRASWHRPCGPLQPSATHPWRRSCRPISSG